MLADNDVHLNDHQEIDPSIIVESLNIHPGTIETLKMLNSFDALFFEFDSGKVFIDPSKLPEDILERLESSQESYFNEETGLYELVSEFVVALTRDRAFSKTETGTGLIANDELLKSLNEKTDPHLRGDLITYSRENFF